MQERELAWEWFEVTGSIRAYLFYKELEQGIAGQQGDENATGDVV